MFYVVSKVYCKWSWMRWWEYWVERTKNVKIHRGENCKDRMEIARESTWNCFYIYIYYLFNNKNRIARSIMAVALLVLVLCRSLVISWWIMMHTFSTTSAHIYTLYNKL